MRDHDVLGIDDELRPETSAEIGGADDDPVLVEPERRHQGAERRRAGAWQDNQTVSRSSSGSGTATTPRHSMASPSPLCWRSDTDTRCGAGGECGTSTSP